MVVHRRGVLMGAVTVAALAVGAAFGWRFAAEPDVVPFLLLLGLLLVAGLHAVAWMRCGRPLLVADLTGLRLRLGGAEVVLPWSEVELVAVSRRRFVGDGRLTMQARDERRALEGVGMSARFALMLNRWLYDAPLVVPYGLSTRVSVPDIPAALLRLADGRARILTVDQQDAEPAPTVEVAPTPTPTQTPDPRRLAGVVSALRSSGSRTLRAPAAPSTARPAATAGALALASQPAAEEPTLPELDELRRRPVEEDVEPVRPSWQPPSLRVGMPPVAALADDEPAAAAIGERIRQARDWLGLTVDDLAERTRIRPFVIESIEAGDFSACGGDFYARGHLRMLTGTLGIDGAPLLASYDKHLASAPVSPRDVFDAELSRGVVRPTGSGSRWGALIVTVLLLLLVWGLAKAFLSDSDPAAADGGAGAGRSALHQRAGAAAQQAPAIIDPSIGDAVPPDAPPVHVTITATGGSSRVVVRDAAMRVIYRGLLASGQSAGISGQGPLRIMAADGGAISLTSAGHPTAVMGQSGQRAFRHISAPKE